MAMRYPGGLIATSPVNAAYPSGVWTQSQTIPYASQNVWQRDQYWRNTTLLLHGDGTNGAQNNTFLDSSSNNFSITRNGNTTQGAFTPFQQNGYWSNYFDGNGDYITAAASSDWSFTGDFTIECWIFPTALTSTRRIISHSGTSGPDSWLVQSDGTSLNFYYASYPSFFTATSALTLNQWQHIAIVRSGSTITIYVNGVSKATATVSATVGSGSYGISIGSNTYLTYPDYYNGYISNLRIVKGTAVYTSAFTPPTGPLTAITNTVFLTCQANRFVDSNTQVSAKTLTPAGNTSVQAFQPFPGPTTWSASVLGGSGYFDGSGDAVYTSSVNSNSIYTGGSTNYTFECFFYLTDLSVNRGIFNSDAGTSGSARGINLYVDTAGAIHVFMSTTGSDEPSEYVSASGIVKINQWYHLALVKNTSNACTVYLNGSSVLTFTSATFAPSIPFYVGASAGAGNRIYQPWTGYISNFRVVNGTAVYTTAFTPPTAPLTNISNTSLLLNFTNAGIFDNAQMNDLETVGNAQISTSVVKYGTGSMYFDGNGDTLPAPDSPNCAFGTGSFTIEFWAYSVDTGSLSSGILDTRSSAGSGTGLFIAPDGTANYRIGYGLSPYTLLSVSGRINNQWQHVAFVRNGSTLMIFIDGVLRGSTSNSTNFSDQKLRISGFVDTQASPYAFNGYLDDLRITKGVARYISNFTPPIARMPNQ